MGTWIFVRHGESVANAEGWLSGHRDVDLTARGVDQAREVGALLRGVTPDRVWSSDLLRAKRTALLALADRDLRIITTPALRERTLGAWEGASRARLRSIGAMSVLLAWDGAPPGGESQRDLALRVVPWLASQDTDGTHLVFAHGGLIRVVTGLLDDVPAAEIGRRVIDNTEIVRRDVPTGRWTALAAALGRPS